MPSSPHLRADLWDSCRHTVSSTFRLLIICLREPSAFIYQCPRRPRQLRGASRHFPCWGPSFYSPVACVGSCTESDDYQSRVPTSRSVTSVTSGEGPLYPGTNRHCSGAPFSPLCGSGEPGAQFSLTRPDPCRALELPLRGSLKLERRGKPRPLEPPRSPCRPLCASYKMPDHTSPRLSWKNIGTPHRFPLVGDRVISYFGGIL